MGKKYSSRQIGRTHYYTEPAPLTADKRALVQSIKLEPTHSRLLFWATIHGLRLGQVGTFMASQVYRVKETDDLIHCVFDWNSTDPPHSHAILALIEEYGSCPSTTPPASTSLPARS